MAFSERGLEFYNMKMEECKVKTQVDNKVRAYIGETPVVLSRILEERQSILSELVDLVTGQDVSNVLIVGSGSSYHSAVAVQAFVEKSLQMAVKVQYPTRFTNEVIAPEKGTLVIGISQGGKSLSTLRAISKAQEGGLKTVGITATKDSELAKRPDLFVPIECGEEQAGAKTKGVAATMLTLLLLGLEVGKKQGYYEEQAYQEWIRKIEATIENLPVVIESAESWVNQYMDEFSVAPQLMVIGYGPHYAIALEGGLKILETVRIPALGYEMEEYMHGIYNCINEDNHLIFLASEGAAEEQRRLLKMRKFLGEHTLKTYVIGGKDIQRESGRDLLMPLVNDPILSIFEYIIPLQLIAALVPLKKGINPAIPKFTSFHQQMGSKLQ